ncbi:MAG: hypothetical protein WDN27_03685 [Candidatus Saccharibacteria bacterium]
MSYIVNAGDPSKSADIVNGTNNNNYFDVSGAFGAYYPNTVTTAHWSSTGNVNMKNGKFINPADNTESGNVSSANLWIDTNGGSCTRQSTAAGYSDGQACASLQAAYNAASSGDVINIMDGVYPGEIVKGATDKSLTFQGIGPGRPSFGQLFLAFPGATFKHVAVENRNYPGWDGVTCTYWDFTLRVCAPNQHLDDVIINGLRKGAPVDSLPKGGLQIDGGSTNFSMKHSEITGIRDNKGFQGGADNLLVEDSLFHDVNITNGQMGEHIECVADTGGNNQAWRRNQFYDCSTINWVAQNVVGGTPFGPVYTGEQHICPSNPGRR